MTKRIAIGSDHAGFQLKKTFIENLRGKGFDVLDLGPYDETSVDYPDFAVRVCQTVLEQDLPGILICGTGLGMSMTANRFKGIRAATCALEHQAAMARAHNNANVLCLGSRISGTDLALAILETFLKTGFQGGRHQRRVDKIDAACQAHRP